MRRWGTIITAAYAGILLFFLWPLLNFIATRWTLSEFAEQIQDSYLGGAPWMFAGIFAACEALLLFLSVDTSFRRLKPRAHVLVSGAFIALCVTVLAVAAIFSVMAGLYGDKAQMQSGTMFLVPALWLFWSALFYRYGTRAKDPLTRMVTWLLRGSVLELLVAVPSHIMVRRRDDCSAPALTSFGIATGIALMLLSFGPSVLFLFKRRIEERAVRARAAGAGS